MDLAPGMSAPRQSTPTTCGSACLVVARMLRDDDFARWIDVGDTGGRSTLMGASMAERFSAYEVLVKARTTRLLGLLGPQLPWPGALGTPPWGALRELAAIAGVGVRGYRVQVLGLMPVAERHRALVDLSTAVRPGLPALLYVGSRRIPRHICLVARTAAGLVVYEPSAGAVVAFDADALARGRLRLGGWSVPWLAVRPR